MYLQCFFVHSSVLSGIKDLGLPCVGWMWRRHVRKERFVTCVQKVSLGIHTLLVKLHGSKLYGRFFPILCNRKIVTYLQLTCQFKVRKIT